MNQKSLLILGALTAAAVAGAFLTTRGGGASEVEGAEKGPLFPELMADVNAVALMRLRQGEDELELALEEGEWVLANRGGYPAKFEKAKETVIQIANLEIEEVKTANPSYFEQLGLEGPTPDGPSREITLLDGTGKTLAAVVLGNGLSRGREAAFVRRVGEDQTYQAKGRVAATSRLSEWVLTDVIKLPAERVEEVVIEHPEGERLEIGRDPLDPARKPLVVGVPEDRELSYDTVANPILGALASLQFEGVDAAEKIELPTDALTKTTFRCDDGLVVAVELAQVDETWWARISASHDETFVPQPTPPQPPADDGPSEEAEGGGGEAAEEDAPESEAAEDESLGDGGQEVDPLTEAQAAYERELQAYEAKLQAAREEATRLNEQHAPWIYALQSYRATNLTKRMDDLLKPLPDPDAPAAPDAGGGLEGQDLQKLLEDAGIDPNQLMQQGGGASTDG